ncbi:voltage-gated ion channel [Lithospermum erythrorhizon]|uniref:Voltage-gated ion channel n=1 Tax=Lithospermum erythrorhizon TaxID=34254 RepID=A0AAV3RVR5_LITER
MIPHQITFIPISKMEESSSTTTTTNGTTLVEVMDKPNNQENNNKPKKQTYQQSKKPNLYTIFNSLVSAIVFSLPDEKYGSAPLLFRVKGAISDSVPVLKEGCKNSANDLLRWTRNGSALRAILVVSVGTIVSLVLTGLLVFMLFFMAATVNAIVISLLLSLAVAGGFLAMFFSCITAIYIGALSVAVFVISIATISAIFAVIIATGWIGFFWIVWLATSGSIHLAKRSLNMTGSVLSAYSVNRHALHDNESTKKSD